MISSNAIQPAGSAFQKVLVILWLALSLSWGAGAQGWEITFGGNKEDYGHALIQTVDHGFLLAGYSESFGVSENQFLDFYLVRTDVDGTIIWQKNIDGGFQVSDQAFDAIQTEDKGFLVVGESLLPSGRAVMLIKVSVHGKLEWTRHYLVGQGGSGKGIIPAVDGDGYVITGYLQGPNDKTDILLLKIDEVGNEIWVRTYGSPNLSEEGTAVVAYEGGYAFSGFTENLNGSMPGNDLLVYRLDSEGTVIWQQYFGGSENEVANDIIRTSDGKLAITGSIGNAIDAYLIKYDADGNLLFSESATIDLGLGDIGYALTEVSNGDIVIGGQTEASEANLNALLVRISPQGDIIWTRSLGSERTDAVEDLIATAGGGFAMAGYNGETQSLFGTNDLTLLKTDGQGNIQSNYITGRVFNDVAGNVDCDFDQFDEPLAGWLVKAVGADNTFFGTTNSQGRYSILVDTGEYVVSVLPAADYWLVCEAIDTIVNMQAFYDTTVVDFPVEFDIACPYMEVDVTTPFLSICSDIEYTVSYCNLGTATALGASVEVTLDDELTLLSASLPYEQDGNLLTFQLGSVPSTACGSFTIQTQLGCNGIADGQAGMVSAYIYPDTVCFEPDPLWDGASVIVAGICDTDNNEVRFEIRNVGQGGMVDEKLFIIVEDQVLLLQDTFRLDPDGIKEEAFPANGSTYRIIAEQSDFHPGMSFPTVAVEGCAVEDGEYSTQQVTQFPENDRDPFIAIDVQEAIGSPSNSTELRGYPKGYSEESLIDAATDITYIIFFSNTGTDTIDRVVIRDTVPPELDIATVQPGASSHPYTFRAYDDGVLKFTFSDMQLLPGSSAGESGSYGYVKFKLSQKLNNAEGSVIENSAAVYFDNEIPRQTNPVRHVVGKFPDFVDSTTVSTGPIFQPGVEIKIAPNPFMESTVFEIEGVTLDEVDFLLYDVSGRLVRRERFRGNRFEFHRKGLNAGLYFYRLASQGQLITTGKVLVR